MKRFLFLFKKIFSFYYLVKNKKIVIQYSNPKKSKIILVDHVREIEVKKALLNDIEFETLDTRFSMINEIDNYTRKPRIFFSLKIILLIFYFFFFRKTNSLFNSYCYAIIYIIKPKVVLDISHYGFILEGVRFFPNTNFIFLLEGLFKKGDESFSFKIDKNVFHYYLLDFLKRNKNLNLGNLYLGLQGERDIDILNDLGLKNSKNGLNLFFSGSYKADYVRKNITNDYKKKYDILFISQTKSEYILNHEKNSFIDLLITETGRILKLLSYYVINKNISCLIQLRTSNRFAKIEKEFFKSFFKDYKKLYFEDRKDPFNAYYSILKSNVTISNHSELSREAMVLGQKSVYIPFKIYDFYIQNPNKFESFSSMWDWHISRDDQKEFGKKIDKLINLDIKKYLEETSNKSNYFIKKNSTLKKIILEMIYN